MVCLNNGTTVRKTGHGPSPLLWSWGISSLQYALTFWNRDVRVRRLVEMKS